MVNLLEQRTRLAHDSEVARRAAMLCCSNPVGTAISSDPAGSKRVGGAPPPPSAISSCSVLPIKTS